MDRMLVCLSGELPFCGSVFFLEPQDRTQKMDSNQEAFIHDSPGNVQSFLDAVNTIKPTAIIGRTDVTV